MLERIYIANNGDPGRLKVIEQLSTLGLMFTPADYRRNSHIHHALDNGAFSSYVNGTPFDDGAFLMALKQVAGPDFVIIPDKVAQGKKSLAYSLTWRDFLPDSFKWYLAVQDGMTPSMIPDTLIKRIAGIFVGGSMEWKMTTAKDWTIFAHSHNLKCHIGRIGTLRGLLFAQQIGADSVDSINFARHRRNWDELLEYLKGEHKQMEQYILTEQFQSK